MYLLAIFLPPLAVLIRKGLFAAIINFVLCLLGFFPGVIHAFIVIAETNADKRTEKLEKKFDELITVQTSKKKDIIKELDDSTKPEGTLKEKQPSMLNRILTPNNVAWFFTFMFFVSFIGSLSEFKYIQSLVFLGTAFIISPATWKALREKSDDQTRTILKVVAVVLVIASLTMSGKDNELDSKSIPSEPVVAEVKPSATPTQEKPNKPEILPSLKPTPKVTKKPEPKPSPIEESKSVITETVSQKNAVRSAKSYLDYAAFSHGGLVAQLEFEKFSHADAVYGADNSGANWNEQAAKSAKAYMEYSAFSRGSLIEQLKHEKFTQAQAEYGANAVGL